MILYFDTVRHTIYSSKSPKQHPPPTLPPAPHPTSTPTPPPPAPTIPPHPPTPPRLPFASFGARSPFQAATAIMMTSSNWNIFRVIGRLCGEFTGHRRIPRTEANDAVLLFSLICVWINCWANNREADDLRRYRAHCDVTVMKTLKA